MVKLALGTLSTNPGFFKSGADVAVLLSTLEVEFFKWGVCICCGEKRADRVCRSQSLHMGLKNGITSNL